MQLKKSMMLPEPPVHINETKPNIMSQADYMNDLENSRGLGSGNRACAKCYIF